MEKSNFLKTTPDILVAHEALADASAAKTGQPASKAMNNFTQKDAGAVITKARILHGALPTTEQIKNTAKLLT